MGQLKLIFVNKGVENGQICMVNYVFQIVNRKYEVEKRREKLQDI